MRTKSSDARVAADRAVLSGMRVKAHLDWIKWTDDEQSLRADVPGVLRSAHWATLHDMTPKKLIALPPGVLHRPIAGLEFSIDFVPKRVRGQVQQFEELCRVDLPPSSRTSLK